MIKQLSITETRKEINNLASTMSSSDTISVTNRGKEVLAIIPWETYESITETLEILSDPEGLELLKQGIADYNSGNTISFEEALKDLDIV